MKFSLNPPSGHADSYVDIQFSVEFEKLCVVKLTFTNETTGSPISIIGVNTGYIENGNIAIFKNTKKCVGFIDLFPEDKMNIGLANKDSITVRCDAIITKDDKESRYTSTAIFYNESQSLDAGVIPFDLIIENKKINLSNHEPLNLKIVSVAEKSFELCIKSNNYWCCFTILARKGTTNITVPAPIIHSDLEFNKNKERKFKVYYVKPEGITYSRFMNRKFIPIMDMELEFLVDSFVPVSTDRKGPVGDLDNNFILSDRYFVHTLKDFSSFKVRDEYPSYKTTNMTWFLHESQDLDTAKKTISTFATSNDMASVVLDTQKEIRSNLMPTKLGYKEPFEKAKLLGVFSRKYSKAEPTKETTETGSQVFSKQSKPCSPCGRNK